MSLTELARRLARSSIHFDGLKYRAFDDGQHFFSVGECGVGCGCAVAWYLNGEIDIEWKKCGFAKFTCGAITFDIDEDGQPAVNTN